MLIFDKLNHLGNIYFELFTEQNIEWQIFVALHNYETIFNSETLLTCDTQKTFSIFGHPVISTQNEPAHSVHSRSLSEIFSSEILYEVKKSQLLCIWRWWHWAGRSDWHIPTPVLQTSQWVTDGNTWLECSSWKSSGKHCGKTVRKKEHLLLVMAWRMLASPLVLLSAPEFVDDGRNSLPQGVVLGFFLCRHWNRHPKCCC